MEVFGGDDRRREPRSSESRHSGQQQHRPQKIQPKQGAIIPRRLVAAQRQQHCIPAGGSRRAPQQDCAAQQYSDELQKMRPGAGKRVRPRHLHRIQEFGNAGEREHHDGNLRRPPPRYFCQVCAGPLRHSREACTQCRSRAHRQNYYARILRRQSMRTNRRNRAAGLLRRRKAINYSFRSLAELSMKSTRLRMFAVVVVALVAAVASQPRSSLAAARAQAPARHHGIEIDHLDRSVKPGDDFYLYCNGAWLKRTEIPADRAVVSVWSGLEDLADERTATLIEQAAKSAGAPGSNAQKIADLYRSYMNESEIEKRGLGPLRPQLAAIDAIMDKQALAAALGETLRQDVDPLNNTNFHTANLFGLWVAPGFDDYQHYIPYLLQGGITLPDREYYVSDSEHMREVRAKFRVHVGAVLKLAGFNDPDSRAARIVDLETAIAQKHRGLAEDQDVHT